MAATRQLRRLILPLFVLVFLRVGQLASTTLTMYASVFYTAFYVWGRHQSAPRAEYYILFTCLFSVFELLYTTADMIYTCCTTEFPRLKYRLYLEVSTGMTVLMSIAYFKVRQVPWLRYLDEANNNGIFYYPDSLERGTCAMNDLMIISGALMVLFTALIAVWAAWGSWYERRYEQGVIRLEDDNADHEALS